MPLIKIKPLATVLGRSYWLNMNIEQDEIVLDENGKYIPVEPGNPWVAASRN
jgi:hypothetical protein